MQVPLKVSLSGAGVLGVAGSEGRRRRFERRPQHLSSLPSLALTV